MLSSEAEKEQAQNEIDHNKEQADIDARAREAALAIKKQEMADELALEKETAGAEFTDAMEDTYLSQLSAEAGYADLKQKNAETLGGVTASNAVAGTKQNTTVRDVLSSQLAGKESMARKQIDDGVANAVTTEERKMSRFDDGSTYMNMYNTRLASLDTMDAFEDEKYDEYTTYMDDLRDDYDSAAWHVGSVLSALGSFGSGIASLFA